MAGPFGCHADDRGGGVACATTYRSVAPRRSVASGPARHPARPAALEPGPAAGRGAAGTSRASGFARRDRLCPPGSNRFREGPGVLSPFDHAETRRGPGAAATCLALTGRPPGCHHGRSGGLLAERLG